MATTGALGTKSRRLSNWKRDSTRFNNVEPRKQSYYQSTLGIQTKSRLNICKICSKDMVSTMAGVTPTGISTNSNSFGILVGIQHFHKWQTGIEWARQLLLSFVHQISFKSRPVVCLPSKKHVKQHFAIQDWKCYSTGVMNWLLKSQAYHNPSCQRGWSAISGATDLTISPTFGG